MQFGSESNALNMFTIKNIIKPPNICPIIVKAPSTNRVFCPNRSSLAAKKEVKD